MSYKTTPPSEPGWYWVRTPCGLKQPLRLCVDPKTDDEEEFIYWDYGPMSDDCTYHMNGYTFGPRIEPPRDDDEELATVEWLREMGIAEMSYDPGLTFMALESTIHIEYTDNTGVTVTLCWETPTRRKVRQIVEALL